MERKDEVRRARGRKRERGEREWNEFERGESKTEKQREWLCEGLIER